VIHLDSSFLIDLLRETRRGRPDGALEFIEQIADDETLCLSVYVASELRVGAELSKRPLHEHEELDRLLSSLVVAYPDERFSQTYSRLLAAITRTGRAIATMDLLIGTAAVIDAAPLVTRNVKDFSRIPGLRVLSY
jgi:predicted nucleic acid-binding protein